ncbi:hypothetical protein FN846DRAFT_886123 [Sphaerosporella brunnea]|uniref:Uncharacterized protein n=1 Tax=Sphaerosporella brunnea TaxID=1250544 RepID=A0A5J5F9W0_9PEZI|nr:hypothetical protein FN846DRAFT_886123 [Sphaerosporella brunnea]
MEEAQEGSEGQSPEARLGICEAELKQVLSRKRPSKSSRKIRSILRYATQKSLQEARIAREPLPPKVRKGNGKGKAEAAHPAAAKGKRSATSNENAIVAQDSKGEREVDSLMRSMEGGSEMEVAEDAAEAAEVERIPRAESSGNAI